MHARACGHDECQQNFVGAWSIGNANLHRVEVAAHVRGVDMRDGNVEARSRSTYFLGGRDDCFCPAPDFTHSVAPGNVPQRAMLQFAGLANDGALALAFHGLGVAAERRNERFRHVEPERVQIFHEARDLLDISTGEGIANHSERRSPPQRLPGSGTTFMENLFYHDDAFSHFHFRHESGSLTYRVARSRGRAEKSRARYPEVTRLLRKSALLAAVGVPGLLPLRGLARFRGETMTRRSELRGAPSNLNRARFRRQAHA